MTQPKAVSTRALSSQPGDDRLVYAVELWREDASAIDQILGRTASISLARAMFVAAKEEHPGRQILLRHGDQVVERS